MTTSLSESFKEERWQRILALLTEHGRVRVGVLAERLNVSEATVRRDLEAMQGLGMLQRTHGGAMQPVHPTAFEVSFDESQTRALVGISRLTVLTNSLAIARELSANPELEIMVLGGALRRQSASLVGSWVVEILRHVRVDKAFLGVNGISVGFGLSSPNPFTAESRQAMIAAARTRIALADHSKLGVEALYHVAPLDALDILVTDTRAADDQVTLFRQAGVEVMTAGD